MTLIEELELKRQREREIGERLGLLPVPSKWDMFKQSVKEAITEDLPSQLSGAVASINDSASFGAIPAIQEALPPWAGGVPEGTYSNAMAAAPLAAMAAGVLAPDPLGKAAKLAKAATSGVEKIAQNLTKKAATKAVEKPAFPVDYSERIGMIPGTWENVDPNAYLRSRKWYHGTSTNAGLETGDYIDPKRGNFSNAVHASPDPRIAKTFAVQTAQLDGGKPIVYELELLPYARVERETAENSSRFKSGDFDPFQAPYLKSGKDSYGFILDDDGQPALAMTDRGPFKVGPVTKDQLPTRVSAGDEVDRAVNESISEYLRRRDAERAAASRAPLSEMLK